MKNANINYFKTSDLSIDFIISDLFANSNCNKYALARYENALKILSSRDSCGMFGKLLELYCCPITSKKTKIARESKADNYTMIYNPNMPKPRRVPTEIKSNGGRIEHTTGKYIIYYCNECGLRICNKETFLNKLFEYKAVKIIHNKNYSYDEYGVRLNKKMINFLLSLPFYNRNDINYIID